MTKRIDNALTISPIDGRYGSKINDMGTLFSEFDMNKYRILVEIEYLISLSEYGVIDPLSPKNMKTLREIYEKFNSSNNSKIKEYEKKTNHDIKAMELFVREKLSKTKLKDLIEMVHFGLTSEDVNNLSNSLMLKKAIDDAYFPNIKKIIEKLIALAEQYNDQPMLSHTHGQPASPTTLGKELSIFAHRIAKLASGLKNLKITGKLAGASGNYNAMFFAYPLLDWIEFSKKFISGLGLEPEIITTQVLPHDRISTILQYIARINNVIIDMDRDIWMYISKGYLKQIAKKGETGSSTMPHKVNPINFENSEGNAQVANSILEFMSDKLQKSRLQRDLTDSTVKRNYGIVIAYTLISIKGALEGLEKIEANAEELNADLDKHPEVLTEAAQTALRLLRRPDAYETMKAFSRGKNVTLNDFRKFVKELKIPAKDKVHLQTITPSGYIGLAEKLTIAAVRQCREILKKL